MKLLAIDTSSNACSVALCLNDKIHELHKIVPMQQSQMILPLIDELLHTAEIELNQLDALAFGCGPGSFTGVRIAASVIQGLAYATGLPIIKISSLAAVAQGAYEASGWKKIAVAMDARIKEVYWGTYQVNEKGLVELKGEEIVCPPNNIPALKDSDWYGAGNAWEVYSLPFHPLELNIALLPQASSIISLAKENFQQKKWIKPEEALPVYLRDKVAEKQKK